MCIRDSSYCVKFATGSFVSGMTTEDTGAMFNNLLADPIEMGLWMALTVIAGFLICSRGLQNGLEKISKIMMVALLFLILLLAAHSFTLSGAREGIRFYEVPIETVYLGKNESSHFNPIKDSWRIYKDILKFSCSSLLSFCVDYICYSIFAMISGSVAFSNICARVISSIFNFSMNKKFVFKNKEGIAKTAAKYFLLAALILSANTIMLELCVKYLIHNKYISKILIEVLLFFISWAAQKSFVFRKRERKIDE